MKKFIQKIKDEFSEIHVPPKEEIFITGAWTFAASLGISAIILAVDTVFLFLLEAGREALGLAAD